MLQSYNIPIIPGLGGRGILGLHPNTLRAPLGVLLELTRACNLRCLHCFADSGTAGGNELRYHEWERLLDELSDMKVPLIFFSGGEPLLYSDFFPLAAYAAQKGFYLCLLSNLVLVDAGVARRLKEVGIHKIEGNLDGPDARIYDRFRGVPNSFERTLTGIRACIEADLPLRINVTVNRLNFLHLGEITELARSLGITELAFLPLIRSGRGDANFPAIELSSNEYDSEVTPRLTALSRRYRGTMTLLYEGETELMAWADPAGIMPACGAGRIHCTITAEGLVKPDVYFPEDDRQVIAGNIREHSLSRIWNESPVFRQMRQPPEGDCRDCPDASCAGGNLYRAYRHHGRLMAGPDPECPYARLRLSTADT